MRRLTEFDCVYGSALKIILDAAPSTNARTGKKVKSAHGMLFQFQPTTVPLLTLRDIKPLWACAEAVWFMGGSDEPDFMKQFGFSIWDKFTDEAGRVPSATGWRWRSKFGLDQLKYLVKKLSDDPTNRQGVLSSWDPVGDNAAPGKNVPCVDMWHFHILEGKLHMSVLQRSGDLYFGVPHDILGSRIVQELLAAGLDVEPGAVSYLVSNCHLYEDQWDAGEEMLNRGERMARRGERLKKMPGSLSLHKDDFARAMICDEALPLELARKINVMYDPWPAITGPKLVL